MSQKTAKLEKCICSGRSLDRMLRPAILTVLYDSRQGMHGYAIEKQLHAFKFFRNQPPDYTGLYRLLKQMELEGILTSAKSDSPEGPVRRSYKMTEQGRQCLFRWLESLDEYREMLDDLLGYVKKTTKM
jgi:DNA-binding PadR family transcriptional regulator